jgi:hypothetical protein
MIRLLTVFLMSFNILAVPVAAMAGQKHSRALPIQEVVLRADRIVTPTPVDRVLRMLPGPDGNLYVLDNGNHRVVVFTAGWRFVRQISEVGQGPGELFDPYDFAIDRAGNIYVIDARKRVQWFSPGGKFLGSFRYSAECLSIAVNKSGEIMLSQPGLGSLMTVYGTDGKPRRSFGALKPAGDSRYQAVANRVHFSVDDDYIYVSFDHLGILQKYDPAGRLIWESPIAGQQVERLREVFWSDAPEKSKLGVVFTTKESGLAAFYVAFDIFLDKSRGLLYVPLNDGTIYVADAVGKPVRLMKQPQGAINFYNSIAVDSKGRLYVASVSKNIFLITVARPT